MNAARPGSSGSRAQPPVKVFFWAMIAALAAYALFLFPVLPWLMFRVLMAMGSP